MFFVGPPGPPIGPLFAEPLGRDSVSLSWQPPEDDGSLPITGYVIEKRDVMRTSWNRAEAVYDQKTEAVVSKLTKGEEYCFRVFAVNRKGQSEALEMKQPILVKSPYGQYITL